ncbi:PIN domain-containing protein, partial [bacterium]|nr:PIN domain-containing protein [bacterium]
EEKRLKVKILLTLAEDYIIVTEEVEKRAIELRELGFSSYNALHIACAEKAKTDIFLTTDDKLLRKAENAKLDVRVKSPIQWILEVIESEY